MIDVDGRGDVCETHYVNEAAVNRVRARMLPDTVAQRLAETFDVLGDPTRMRIIYALLTEELCVCDLSALLGMSQSAISHQLRVLRNLRLVKYRKDRKIVYYSLDDDHIKSLLSEGLAHVEEGKVEIA